MRLKMGVDGAADAKIYCSNSDVHPRLCGGNLMKDIAMKRYIGTKIIQAEPSHSTSDNPEVGQPGYKVVYADGYTSWSPQGAFEEAYRPCDAMTFGLALEALKKGLKVQRGGWNGKGLWLELQVPDAHSKMTLPYIFMSYPSDAKTTPGARVPWLASQTDMLAEDWVIVD